MSRRSGAPPILIVHHRAHMEAALRAARDAGRAVVLASPPGGAAYAGPAFYLAAFEQACRVVPGGAAELVIDCGDDPGVALAALRAGARRIRVALPPALARKVREIARQFAAQVDRG